MSRRRIGTGGSRAGDDSARVIVLATPRYDGPDPVNIGAGFEITIAHLAKKIRQIVGYQGQITWDASKPDGQPHRQCDTSRVESRLGFKAAIDFDEGVRRTVEWYRDQRVQTGPRP